VHEHGGQWPAWKNELTLNVEGLMPMSNAHAVLTDVSDGLATLTLNKPVKLNAWDTPMRAEIAGILKDWNGDGSVRAVIVTGTGERAFSAGQDLDETEKFTSGSDGANWFQSWRDFYNAIRDLDKPCVAALNGVAAGSAFQAAMLMDVRVGHRAVRMGQAEINSGIPSVTGPMLMLPRIGLSRTIELTLSGRMMEAEECHAIGLIHYLVERREDVLPKAREVALMLAAKPPIAMRLTKARFRQVTQPAFDEAFANGSVYQAEAFASGEPQAAMRTFFAERAARRKARAAGSTSQST
jgi:enoyl-CoA hydratase